MEKQLKSFQDLYAIDISADVKKKPTFKKENGKFVKLPEKYWLDYLEWATVLVLLYKHGAKSVKFYPELNSDSYPIFYDHNKVNPFVRVSVEIDENKHTIDFPVIDGNRANQTPNQLDIHVAQQRAFVKCVAINTGLGLKLWQKEETNLSAITNEESKPPFPDEKFKTTVEWLKKGGDIEKIKEVYSLDQETENNLLIAVE